MDGSMLVGARMARTGCGPDSGPYMSSLYCGPGAAARQKNMTAYSWIHDFSSPCQSLPGAFSPVMRGRGGIPVSYKAVIRCSCSIASEEVTLHWTNAWPRHTRQLQRSAVLLVHTFACHCVSGQDSYLYVSAVCTYQEPADEVRGCRGGSG